MAGEWREVTVEELKARSENALATGPFGSSIGSRFFVEDGVPVIRGSNLSGDVGTRLIDIGLVFLTAKKAREFGRSLVRDGDLVFTCWGTVNQVGLIDRRAAHREYVISNKQMKLTPDPAKADSLFLYYMFSGPELQDRIKNQSIGSSVPGFNLGQLRGMRVRIPDVGEQRAIAHILGSLDDKIELNRRMSETLEAMARALFKSWFVDFDPVRAKAEGRLPAGRQATPPVARAGIWFVYALECENGSVYIGYTEDVARRFDEHVSGKGAEWTKQHPPRRVAYWEELPTRNAAIGREKKLKTGAGREWLKAEIAKRDIVAGALPKSIADLFPARLVESELGDIPEGWEVGTLADVSTLNPEVWSKHTRPEEIQYVDLSNTKWGRIEAVTAYQADDAPSRAQRVLRPGDTIVGTVRPGNGSYAFISNGGLTGSTGFAVLRPSTPQWAQFVYLAATAAENIDALAHLADGGAYPAVRPEVVAGTSTVRPDDKVLGRFSLASGPLLAKIAHNESESRTLAALRDTLLPKLISGALRVKDAEKFVAKPV